MNTKTHSISSSLRSLGWAAAGFFAHLSAYAASDLPGGPAVNQLNLHPAVTKIATEQHWLHWFMLILCSVIFIAVFAVMFYSIFKHRKSKGHQPQELPEPIWVEIGWTLVPFFIVIGMALPATKVLVAQKDTTNADLTIKVTGYQWKWGYDYLKGEGEGLKFISTLDTAHRELSNNGSTSAVRPNDYLLKVDNPMVVPADKKIRLITTANDVIHSFMVPAFGIKQDAIPGFVRDTWFRTDKVGTYYGQCVELCGKEHAYMPIQVKVVSAADYTAWVAAEQKKAAALAGDPNKVWTMADMLKRGEKVYGSNCAACHQANGKGGGPIKALDGSAVVLGPAAMQMQVLLNGQNNGAMPAWKQLSDTDLAAVTTFTKNHWSNQTGQLIQPAQYRDARGGNFPAGGASTNVSTGATTPGTSSADNAAQAPDASAKEIVVAEKTVASVTAATATAPATAAAATKTATSTTGNTALPAKVFFASGKAALDNKAKNTIAGVLQYAKSHPEAQWVLSGFVDATGNAQANAELAKIRAKTVRDALQAGGIAADRIELRKPTSVTAEASNNAAARRVEIALAK